ncbi:hypothetical protein QQF64_017697 [Cirrhinus molitorella]|uniref:Uncharacterized protein n=1 Tax=Cirrhinus molitorella TaxID=172907 RepID=A0ABR3LMT0_9TELE
MLRLGVPPPLVGPSQTRVRVIRSSEKSLSCTGPQERRWIPGGPERERRHRGTGVVLRLKDVLLCEGL